MAALLAGAEAARDTAVVRAGEINKDRIDKLTGERDEIAAALEKWARDNRDEFAGKQELALNAGVLVFRVGNPEVVLLEKWTWKKVLAAMVRSGKVLVRWKSWVRIKFEVNKQNILAEFGKKPEVVQGRLKDVGMRVDREETFSVNICVSAQP